MTIIGFCGKAGSGKSTACNFLLNKDANITELAFAKPLKDACKCIFSLTDEQVYGTLKETPLPQWDERTPRQILQYVGTDLFRKHFCDDIWIRAMKCAIEACPTKHIIISDVRFANECDFVKSMGGIVIMITRNVAGSKSGKNHASENMEGINADITIENNGTLGDFKHLIFEHWDQILNNNEPTNNRTK